MKKILFYIPNLDKQGVPIIWLIKIRQYQRSDFQTFICTGSFLLPIPRINNVYTFNSRHPLPLKTQSKPTSKFSYIPYSLKKNFDSLKFLHQIVKLNPDAIYTPSSVLDFLIFLS